MQTLLELDRDGHAILEVVPGEEVHYTKQGNADFYTADALWQREHLSGDTNIKAAIGVFWHVVSQPGRKSIGWPQ